MRAIVRPLLLVVAAFIVGALLNPFGRDRHEPPTSAADVPTSTSQPPTSHLAAAARPTQESAIETSVAFVCNGQRLLDATPVDAEALVRGMVASASADEQVARHLSDLRAVRRAVADGTGPIVYRQSAIAWRVESFDDGRARIAIWNVGVLTRAGVAPPQASWAISTVDLTWAGDRWLVVDSRVVPGPAPILSDTAAPATASQFTAALDGFTDFGEAVE